VREKIQTVRERKISQTIAINIWVIDLRVTVYNAIYFSNCIFQDQEVSQRGYDMRRGIEVDYESAGKYSTDAYTEEAVKIIKNHNGSQVYIENHNP